MGIIWILIIFILYALFGKLICDKIGALYGSDDTLELISDGVLVALWPLTVVIHFLMSHNNGKIL